MADNNCSSIKEDVIEQIEKLDVLREKGFITREEIRKEESRAFRRFVTLYLRFKTSRLFELCDVCLN